MRGLSRNNRILHYALRVGEVAVMDEYGNDTGEETPVYSPATPLSCNISAAVGEDAVQAFGNFTAFKRTVYVADRNCPMAEGSVVWFGVEPTEQYNYLVVRKADGKNGILYALQEVAVT